MATVKKSAPRLPPNRRLANLPFRETKSHAERSIGTLVVLVSLAKSRYTPHFEAGSSFNHLSNSDTQVSVN